LLADETEFQGHDCRSAINCKSVIGAPVVAEPQLNLTLTDAQRKIVAHFGAPCFIADKYEREKYFELVAKELRTIPRITDMHAAAAAIHATTIAKRL
jgi:hypothetical protein